MPTIKATAADFALISQRIGTTTWTSPEYTAVFTLNLPKQAVVDSAILSYTAGYPIIGGSSLTVDGQQTGDGAHSISIPVEAGAETRSVLFTFHGRDKEHTTAVINVTGVSLTVTYHLDYVPPFGHAENGQMVTYSLYHAEGGSLIPYSLYHGENGTLVKY